MKYQPLLLMPLAALCLGDSAQPPARLPPIPDSPAKQSYLFAYALSAERPDLAKLFCEKARAQLGPAETILSERITRLCEGVFLQ